MPGRGAPSSCGAVMHSIKKRPSVAVMNPVCGSVATELPTKIQHSGAVMNPMRGSVAAKLPPLPPAPFPGVAQRASSGGGASSSNFVAVSRVQCSIPWPCTQCMRMPWRCMCHQAEDRIPEQIEQIEQDFELICKRAGVWEDAEALQGEADQKAAQLEPPDPHRTRDMWSCEKCSFPNVRFDLVCSVAGCGGRRPLIQTWLKEYWICEDCQNHNHGWRRWCNWSACPSNDWRCTCGNINRSNRKICNRRVCGLPRSFSYD